MTGRYRYILLILLLAGQALLVRAQDEGLYKVEKLSVSSNAYNDMTPVIQGETLLFCSDRRYFGWKNEANFEGRKLYSIYTSHRVDSGKYDRVEPFAKEIQSIGDEGPFCFSPGGNQIYFTRSIETGKKARRKGKISNTNGIFIADRSGNGWTNIRPFEYNDPLWQTAHPCVSPDGKYLFFASNRPGGSGMSDIYMCENDNGRWKEPVDLGPGVNSPAADLYPWFSAAGELYFASDRSGGLGGLDIYSTRLVNGKWSPPVLLPEPINSRSNDFSYIIGDGSSDGYFTSDRDRNDDIYYYSSLIIRKSNCNDMVLDKFCYVFEEENAVRFDSLPYEYEWDFDDGKKAQGVTAEHCFDNPGTYIVKLNVIDKITGDIQYNEVSYILNISRTEQAFIEAPADLNAGESVTFDAAMTNLPGWNISQYYWSFDDGTIADGIRVDKVYTKPGTYNVQLIVKGRSVDEGVARETCVSKIVVVKQPQ